MLCWTKIRFILQLWWIHTKTDESDLFQPIVAWCSTVLYVFVVRSSWKFSGGLVDRQSLLLQNSDRYPVKRRQTLCSNIWVPVLCIKSLFFAENVWEKCEKLCDHCWGSATVSFSREQEVTRHLASSAYLERCFEPFLLKNILFWAKKTASLYHHEFQAKQPSPGSKQPARASIGPMMKTLWPASFKFICTV